MMLPRQESQNIASSIERRLALTIVAGGVRPLSTAGPVPRANVAGTGLFVVKPGTKATAEAKPSQAEERKRLHGTRLRKAAERRAVRGTGRARMLPMGVSEKHAGQERLLGLMAALGPLLWFGHAALVWLRFV